MSSLSIIIICSSASFISTSCHHHLSIVSPSLPQHLHLSIISSSPQHQLQPLHLSIVSPSPPQHLHLSIIIQHFHNFFIIFQHFSIKFSLFILNLFKHRITISKAISSSQKHLIISTTASQPHHFLSIFLSSFSQHLYFNIFISFPFTSASFHPLRLSSISSPSSHHHLYYSIFISLSSLLPRELSVIVCDIVKSCR